MAGARDGTWELSAGVGVMVLGEAINPPSSSVAAAAGGLLRVGYNINEMWNISIGSGLGYGGEGSRGFAAPFAAITWTPDINMPTSPFITAGVGVLYSSAMGGLSDSYGGVHGGVGMRHMIGENLALRIEGMVQYLPTPKSADGFVTVGLSAFVGGKHVLTHIAVNPGTATLASLRATTQFSAIAHDQKGRPMAGKVFSWRSSNPAVATVSNTGLVTATGDGSATISAVAEGVTGSANVMVSRTAAAVAVAPTSVNLTALGATQPLTASARDQGNSPLTGVSYTWTSSNPAVATVSPSGLVTAAGNGTANITLASAGRTATASVTVAQMTASINVTPSTSSLTAAAATSQLAAQALDANGRPINGKTFTWTSDAAGVATVNNSGLATAVANGVAHFSAATDGKTGSAIVTVLIATRAAPPIELPAVNASMVLRNVTFRANSAVLLPAAMPDLDKVAITMQGLPSSRWQISGYTSNVGAAARNLRLSQQRADAVKTYLVSKGVPAVSLTTAGFGAQNPIANNRTAAGRRQNMRVEIKRLQ
jgi:outer membrane protein OmpA-like peptidoglycan-associated protein